MLPCNFRLIALNMWTLHRTSHSGIRSFPDGYLTTTGLCTTTACEPSDFRVSRRYFQGGTTHHDAAHQVMFSQVQHRDPTLRGSQRRRCLRPTNQFIATASFSSTHGTNGGKGLSWNL